jgi:hypothetical protein
MKRWLTLLILVLGLALMAGAAAAQETPSEATAESPAAETAPAEAASGGIPAGLITGLRHLHSAVRWLVVIITVVVLVKLVIGFTQNAAYDSLTSRLMVAFTGGLSLQWLIGLVFLIIYGAYLGFGNLQGHNWLHLIVMTAAVGLAHWQSGFKKLEDRLRYRNTLVVVVIVLALVFIGVQLLPQGWRVFPPSGA